ncbi:MAG: TatD family hydrolase [Bacteroidales bacterium]
MFIDIHTHHADNKPNILEVIQSDPREFRMTADKLYSLGVHPWETEDPVACKASMHTLQKLISNGLIPFAIGECGLDKLRGGAMVLQMSIFEKQIQISEELKIPIIIHCVKAWDELIRVYRIYKPKQPWIIHGFRGKPQLAEQLLTCPNLFLSFGLLYNVETWLSVPLDRVFLETDTVQQSIESVYYKAAKERNIDLNDFISQIECNFAYLR